MRFKASTIAIAADLRRLRYWSSLARQAAIDVPTDLLVAAAWALAGLLVSAEALGAASADRVAMLLMQ